MDSVLLRQVTRGGKEREREKKIRLGISIFFARATFPLSLPFLDIRAWRKGYVKFSEQGRDGSTPPPPPNECNRALDSLTRSNYASTATF